MNRVTRWAVAAAATAATFVVSLWAGGSLLLPHFMKSDADRWVVAAGLGVALAALAALWGASWAVRQDTEATPPASGERSVSPGGDVTGIASTGDHTTNIQYK